MRRHILSRPTWRPYRWSSTTALCPSRYASIRTLLVSLLFGDSVHCEIHLFGLLRRRCNLRSGLASSSWRVDQVRIAQSPHARSEAIGHREAVRLALGPLRRDHHLLFLSFAAWVSLLPLSCLASKAMGVRSGSYTSALSHKLCSSTASFLATATTARFLAFFPPREAIFSPWRLRSESDPKGPRM